MKIKPLFAWYDFWVGLFWDSQKRRLYVFPIPMFGFVVQFNIIPVQGAEAMTSTIEGQENRVARTGSANLPTGAKFKKGPCDE